VSTVSFVNTDTDLVFGTYCAAMLLGSTVSNMTPAQQLAQSPLWLRVKALEWPRVTLADADPTNG
jgi:hypothetical protein